MYLPPPRYDRSIEDTFFETTCTAIEGYDDLPSFETNGPNRNKRLPSWVPDWAHGWRRMYGAPLISTKGFSAGGVKALYQIDCGKKLLKLKCKFVDEIVRLGATVPVNEDTPIFAFIQSGCSIYKGVPEDSWTAWEVSRGWASLVQNSYSQSAVPIDNLFSTLLGDSIISVPSKFSSGEPLLDWSMRGSRSGDGIMCFSKLIARWQQKGRKVPKTWWIESGL
ncbi:hypothetical protein H2198_007663 [Neophaeococcomyces mojaviensis]|uniref:Uncharacterized protein n=1 Tax=Neophaeococcomyces mojaviensis TaxID=3383035 RepID=A0ACC2ZZG0_9EURO|nr:hypothetical protein H2198_007663 [Knufia sp. JES_112]